MQKSADRPARTTFFFLRRAAVVLLLLLQIAAFVYIVFAGTRLSVYVGYAFRLLSLLVALWIISGEDEAGYKLLWMFLLLLTPLFGGVFYLLLRVQSRADRFARKRRAQSDRLAPFLHLCAAPQGAEAPPPGMRRPLSFLEEAGFLPCAATDVTYLSSGEEAYAALLAALRQAKRYIFLEYFIVEEGAVWDRVHAILREKAAGGVDVRLLMDDGGCFFLHPRRALDALRAEGIACRVSNPFRPVLSARQNYRDHRKIAVVDGEIALTGGVNLGDAYVNRASPHGHWKDSALRLRGRGAYAMALHFLAMWNAHGAGRENYARLFPDAPPVRGEGVTVPFVGGPDDRVPLCATLSRMLVAGARRSLYITTPYLIPDEGMAGALCLAARGGVDVRILTPYHGDRAFVHATTRSFYAPLLDAGVRIYEYTPGFIHAKSMVVDGRYAVVGSANLDYRSLYLNYECGVLFSAPQAVRALQADFLATQESGRRVFPRAPSRRPFSRLVRQVLRLLSPLM